VRRLGVALALGSAAVGVVLNLFGRRNPWRRYPWYLAGVATGIGGTELGAPVAATQVLAGGLAIRLGAGRTTLGRAGLTVAASTAAGLIGLHHKSTNATATLDAALTDAFGPNVADRPAKTTNVVAAKNIRYHDQSSEQILDIRRPQATVTPAPVMIYVHGSSWIGGSRSQGAHLITELAARGWICVSIDYRLGPRNRWPTLIVDVKRAIAWVRANIAAYGGDPSFIAVTGGSAGAHLAALAALSPNDPAFQPGFTDADTTIQAAALLYGVYDLTALNDDGQPRLRNYVRKVMFEADLADDPRTWRAASPTHRLNENAPPLFLIHGDRDEIVSVNQARRFAEHARKTTTQPFGYAELPYAHHAFDIIRSPRTKAAARAVGRFLDTARDRHLDANSE
jgi:acetyl esterase/lipase